MCVQNMSLSRSGQRRELKKKKIMTSSLQDPFKTDSQNTDQLIKTAVVYLLS